MSISVLSKKELLIPIPISKGAVLMLLLEVSLVFQIILMVDVTVATLHMQLTQKEDVFFHLNALNFNTITLVSARQLLITA